MNKNYLLVILDLTGLGNLSGLSLNNGKIAPMCYNKRI